MVSDTAANSSAGAMAFLLTVVGAFLCASPAVAMDDNMRHHARRALGVALSVAERSLDQLLPPSNGPPASPYNQVWQPNWVTPHGLVPQPCAASGAVFDPARQTWARACGGPGVNLMGCSTYGQPMPGPPPLTRPPVAASGARPDVGPPRQQRQPDASTRHSSRRSADGNVRRSRSRARRSALLGGRPGRSSPTRARAGGAAPVRSQQARGVGQVGPRAAQSPGQTAAAPTRRPIFQGQGRPSAPAVGQERPRRTRTPRPATTSASVNPLTPRQPPGLYVRGLRAAASVDQVERLFERLSSFSPTLFSLPQMFSLHMYRTGAATVMHPAFADRGLVEQVLGELGVGPNSEPAAIPTEDFGDVAVRGAREALSIADDDDV